jgi:chromate transporter
MPKMSPQSPPAAPQAPELSENTTKTPPGVITLFFAFAKMSLAGFGGVLAFARRGIVEEHKWMTADEFNETFALCHFLPGPNIVNLSVVFGSRFAGIPGAIAAFAGLVGPPMVIMMAMAVLYAHFGQFEVLRRILAGISCGAVGLLLAVVVKMLMPLIKRWDISGIVLMIAVFVAIGFFRLPLQTVLLVAVPVSLGITFMLARRARIQNKGANQS